MTAHSSDQVTLQQLASDLSMTIERMCNTFPIWRGPCVFEHWWALAQGVYQSGGRLVALWSDTAAPGLHVTYVLADELLWATLPAPERQKLPDLSLLFPVANRLQRAARDLSPVPLEFDAPDQRPWLDHGCWIKNASTEVDSPSHTPPDFVSGDQPYPFVPVTGEGVHEIAVGPVHAGIIEPGHFRFSVVGEKVLRLEAHLGYTHKGAATRWRQFPALQGHRLAGRLCGDSTVAYSWAYCMALEAALGWQLSDRLLWLRALLVERERVANHLGDLGALGNDAGFAVGLAHFSRLKEDWLRLSGQIFGHRLLMDTIVPGGVSLDPTATQRDLLHAQCAALEPELLALREIYDNHAGLQDRFGGTGQVSPALARQLGLTGMAGRASGIATDLRRHPGWAPYNTLDVRIMVQEEGDVAARVALRFNETLESLRLIRHILSHLPASGSPSVAPIDLHGHGQGFGRVEGWRGEIQLALQLDSRHDSPAIREIHLHDPSWHNWPVLEHAILGNIVPDFPLINKSFNLCYSGHDQ